jgi:hypothetical protein
MRCCPFSERRRRGERDQTEKGNRTAALAACRRGTIEEDWRPVSGDRMSLVQYGRRSSEPDKEDSGDEHHERHYRVHHNAELAMIGVTPNRVYMRYLGDCQKRQQDKANHRNRLQSARP